MHIHKLLIVLYSFPSRMYVAKDDSYVPYQARSQGGSLGAEEPPF